MLFPAIHSLIEKAYRIVRLNERDLTDDTEDEEVLLLRVKVYESLLEKKSIEKNYYVSEILKTLKYVIVMI
jgi:hypothetical protein